MKQRGEIEMKPFTYAFSLAERGKRGLVNVTVLDECWAKRL